MIAAFFILAVQLFITILEFKLTTLAGFVLVPFGLWGKSAFLAERVLGNVITTGVKVLILAVVVGIGSTLFGQFTAALHQTCLAHLLRRTAFGPFPGQVDALVPGGTAAALAADGTSPPSDLNGDADYRRHLATVLTRRAVLAAAGTG